MPNSIAEIESAILSLPPQEFRRLSDWIVELDHRRWDEQFEQDVLAGRLDALAAEAVADHEAGNTQEI